MDAAGIPWKMGFEGNKKVVTWETLTVNLTVQASLEKNKSSVFDASAGLQTLGEMEINLYRAEVDSVPAIFDFVATGKSA